MIEELKPCPMTVFPWLPEHELRIVDGLQASNGAPIEYAAGCVDCDIYTDQCRTRDEAIAAWNTRTAYDPDKRLREALERVEQLKSELDEESTWRGIVDAHGGLDPFDDMAEAWVAREPIKRMFNAVTSVFAKVSNDDIMGRYKKSLGDLVHDAFVEGCIAGSRARAALSHNGG